jgi:tetratricopeptide (TPR) repeat protein
MGYMMQRILGFVCFAAALATTPIFAEMAPEIKWCINEGNSFSADLQIKGCTALLRLGKGTADMRGEAFQFRGEAYFKKNEYDKAIADFGEAIKLKFKLDQQLFRRGYAYAQKKDYRRAIADYSRAIKLNDKVADYYLERGRAIALGNDPLDDLFESRQKDALADFDQAVKLDPKLAEAFYLRGVVKKLMSDEAGGEADIAHARELDPQIEK